MCGSCDHAVDHVTCVDHVTMCVGHVTMLGDYVCGSQDMVRGECIDCELKFCK